MRDLVIFGAGSFGRETAQLVNEINMDKKQWNLLGFIDDTPEKQGKTFNDHVVLGNIDWLKNVKFKPWVVCAIDPKDKFRIIKRLSRYGVATRT